MLLYLSLALFVVAVLAAGWHRRNILHPSFWTNLGFAGYAVGGVYFSVYGFDDAMFLNLAQFDPDRSGWFVFSMLIVMAGMASCNLGFIAGDLTFGGSRKQDNEYAIRGLSLRVVRLAKVFAIALMLLGVSYWLYFAVTAAGGVLELLQNVSAYKYLAADARLSALPFHFAYAGVELWLLAWLSGTKARWVGLLMLPIGMMMVLTTGRISSTIVFGFSGLLTYLFVVRPKVNHRYFSISFLLIIPMALIFYFYRQYTSYNYIGKSDKFSFGEDVGLVPVDSYAVIYSRIKFVLSGIVDSGNIPDLQQIILVVSGISDGKVSLAFGETYFDWVRNLIASGLGSDSQPLSVGYRVLNAYFPGKVGGPTPGMIGEAILNFGFLAPIALSAFCFAMVWLYKQSVASRSVLTKFLYCQFLVGIWALFLKVDSSLLLGYFWMVAPISLCWIVLTLLAGAAASSRSGRTAAASLPSGRLVS